MRLVKSTRPRHSDEHLIPLINVVFLMLIFFMVVGHITAADLFAVEPPESTSDAAVELEVITVLVSADGQFAVDGTRVDAAGITAAVAQKLEAIPAATPAPVVTLKADAAMPVGQLNQVLNALRTAGSSQVTLLTAREH